MLYGALTAVSALVYLGCGSALTCHCRNNAQCDPVDGTCDGRCEKGWYGPGCQIGNLALNKNAFQSTTYDLYTADNAVNGIVPPPGDISENNCSHTSESQNVSHWWYVNLSDSEDFVLKNITIVNRQGENAEYLRNFYILYTSDTTSDPDPLTWNQCTFISASQIETVAIYTCTNVTAIGRRVAVYLLPSRQFYVIDKLALCEVYVDGYSYNATTMFRDIATNITSTCGSMVIQLSTLPIVPPTNLIVQLRTSSESNVVFIRRKWNTLSGLRYLTVPVLANRTYSVSVAPETCCIGAQCLNNFKLDFSKCVTGESSIPVVVTMPRYRQYALRKVGKVISITSLNEYSCSSTNLSVNCQHSSAAYNSTDICTSNNTCELDPRYNYKCTLTVLFSDGFYQKSLENFNVRTANFSSVNIQATIACNSVSLVVDNMTAQWDLEPSLIEIYVASAGSNDTDVHRVVFQATGLIAANFSVKSNSTYTAWAIPVTYLSSNDVQDTYDKSCNDTQNCIVGEQTLEIAFTTLQRKYNLASQDCCASFADTSSPQCETPVQHQVTCSSEANYDYNGPVSQSAKVCGLKPNIIYACNRTVYLSNGKIESYNHFYEIANQSSCPTTQQEAYQVTDSPSTSAAIGSSVAGIAIITGVVTSIAVIQKRRKTLANGRNVARKPNIVERISVLQMGYRNFGVPEDAVYGNTCGMGVEEFERYTQNETSIFTKFSELGSIEGHPCTVGLENTLKNRFRNIVPYDINRVTINEGTCNYINASYINGFNQEKKYIATQGPISQTIADFWTMVWQENVTSIIMLTDYVEQAKKKCERYFPRTGNDTGGISVEVKAESMFDTHCLSLLDVCHEGQTRAVRHFHFLAWPDKSVPEHCGSLLMFHAKTRELIPSTNILKAPIVVHCSAGVGRTGAFIALDCLLSRYFSEGRVDVDSCVLKLRDQRMHMVQTKEQYMFLHKVLLFGLKTYQFMRNATDLYQVSTSKVPRCENFIEHEFEILRSNLKRTPDDPVYVAARSEDNLHKNRNPNILASESTRPFLGTLTGNINIGGYINAVYCNGCYAKNSFIVTQWPLKDTIADFWELVYASNPSCIIVLHQSPSLKEYPEFYPDIGQSLKAGQFTVTNTNFKKNAVNCANEHELSVTLLSRSAACQDEGRLLRLLECDIFDFDSALPKDFQQTTSFIMDLQQDCKHSKDHPIVVVCKDGATFCGLFVAATNSLHRLIESNQVQIFHTVDLLRASRPEFISSLGQYSCLYQIMSFSTEENVLYTNMQPQRDK